MKSPTELIEQIIRAKMALHLKLAACRSGGQVEIGGRPIDDMTAEVSAGRARYEQMLVCFKNEIAAAETMASAGMEVDDEWRADRNQRPPVKSPKSCGRGFLRARAGRQ